MKTKNILLHTGLVLAMLAVSLICFSPVLKGKVIMQGDIQKYEAMVKETKDYHTKTGNYAHWNSAMFSGMPAYQVGGNPPSKSVYTPLQRIGTLQFLGLERSAGVLFFYLIGFYVALIALGCSPLLALLGALAFGLGSYNIIIIEAGHITKAWAMAMMAPVLAGMVLCLRKPSDKRAKWLDWLWGGLLFTIALGLQLICNHIQITYYTIIGASALGIAYFVNAIVHRYVPRFAASVGILLLGGALAFACNARNLMVSQQYAQQTMRGGNAITITPESLYSDTPVAKDDSEMKSGLDIDYAYSWSYGIGETYTILVPGARGGSNNEPVGKDSESYRTFRQSYMPLYWGDQPFTSGPVYFGAIVMFLFILGLLTVRGPERWWLLAAAVVGVLLSWGRNFMPLNEWVFNHLPLYNKFRTPSMSLVLSNVAVVVLGMLGLRQLFSHEGDTRRKTTALYISAGATVAVLLIGLLSAGSLAYSGLSDTQMAPQYGSQWAQIQDIFVQDRQALFVSDSWRSILFVVLAFAVLWLYVRLDNNGSRRWLPTAAALALCALVVVDLWGVDSRYLNEKNYVSKSKTRLTPDPWDATIDQYAAQFGDRDYRVLNMATNTFNDSKPAAFHHQIGGYSAAKMRRYQDIIDFYISRQINMQVLNMLNTRYFVVQGGQVQRNPDALGNCWFVDSIKWVADANEEILALNKFNPATTAVVDRSLFTLDNEQYPTDSSATIVMEHQNPYNPDYLRYTSHSNHDRLAVFSETYYEPDWRAYIDGKPANYIRANYLLRAMVVPAGDHVIEFRNEAPLFHRMDAVAIVGSIVLVIIAAGAIVLCYRRKKN
ncbi:MAG: hypothetical protein K5650_08105 [Bacteroidales bacterium]|nr:hypothetical protein [Bacteroidales bacterium]